MLLHGFHKKTSEFCLYLKSSLFTRRKQVFINPCPSIKLKINENKFSSCVSDAANLHDVTVNLQQLLATVIVRDIKNANNDADC